MLIRNHVAIVVVGVGIAVVSAYVIGTSDAVVSRVLRERLMSNVRAPCTFDHASFTFLGGVRLHGLVVSDPDAPFSAPLLTAETAVVDYKLGAFGLGPRITDVSVERPRLKIERAADGSLPIKRLVDFAGGGPKLRPFVVKLRGGLATFADPSLLAQGPLALTDVNLDVTPQSDSADWTHAVVALTAKSDVLGAVKADAVVGRGEESFVATLDLPQIRFDAAVARRFVGETAKGVAEMSPAGTASAHVQVRVGKGRPPAPEAEVVLHDVSVRVSNLDDPPPEPIDVTKINGRLHYAAGRLDATDLAFTALGATFRAQAAIDGIGRDAPRLDATASMSDLALDDALRRHVRARFRRIAEAYDVRGTGGATATVKGPLDDLAVGVVAKLTHGHVRYDGYLDPKDGVRHGYAYDADDVTGTVTLEGPTISIDATGSHGPATLHATGTVVTSSAGRDVPDITIVADDVPLDDAIRKAFHDGGEKAFVPYAPSGTAQTITVHVRHDPIGKRDAVDVRLKFDGRARFSPHVFPAAFTDAVGDVEVLEPDGARREDLVRLKDLTARGDGFGVRVSGEVLGDHEDLRIHADVAEAGGAFRAAVEKSTAIPKNAIAAMQKLDPSGALGIDAHVLHRPDGTRGDVVDFDLRGTNVAGYGDVRLAARKVTGRVHLEGEQLTFENLAGELALGEFAPPFRGFGKLVGISGTPEPTIHVEAAELPLGDALREALGPLAITGAKFWDVAQPVGSVRAGAVLDLRPSTDRVPFEVSATGIHGALRPLGLEIDCDGGSFHYDGFAVQVRDLDAAIGAATMKIDSADYDMLYGVLDVRVSALRALKFPEDLEGPLARDTIEKIVESAPGRILHAPKLHVVYRPNPRSIEIDGDVSFRPRSRHATGEQGYRPDGNLSIERLAFLMPEYEPVSFDGEARADDFAFKVGVAVEKMFGPIAFSGTLGAKPTFRARTTGASFRVEDFPLEKADVEVDPTPAGERVNVKKANFMAGDFQCVVATGDRGVGYQGKLTIEGADLEKFLRSRGDVSEHVATGVVDGDLQFHNPTGVFADLRGDGKLVVSRGHLSPAPGVGAAGVKIATLGVVSPDLTDAEMKFDLNGDRLILTKLEVTSDVNGASALTHGSGWVELGGRLDVSVDLQIFDINIPVVRQLFSWFQRPWPTRVRILGTLRNPRTAPLFYDFGLGHDVARPEPQPAGDVRPPERDPW